MANHGTQLDKQIGKLTRKHSQGKQINILDISKYWIDVRTQVRLGVECETAVLNSIKLFYVEK